MQLSCVNKRCILKEDSMKFSVFIFIFYSSSCALMHHTLHKNTDAWIYTQVHVQTALYNLTTIKPPSLSLSHTHAHRMTCSSKAKDDVPVLYEYTRCFCTLHHIQSDPPFKYEHSMPLSSSSPEYQTSSFFLSVPPLVLMAKSMSTFKCVFIYLCNIASGDGSSWPDLWLVSTQSSNKL